MNTLYNNVNKNFINPCKGLKYTQDDIEKIINLFNKHQAVRPVAIYFNSRN